MLLYLQVDNTTIMKRKSLLKYVTEGLLGKTKLEDYDKIVYEDGYEVDMQAVKEKIKSCYMYIMSNVKYFTPALKSLTIIYSNKCDTMATDGIRLFINPRFADGLTDMQVVFVLLHECMHCVLNHMVREKRAGCSDHTRANIAADYECNGILEWSKMIKTGTTESLGGFIDEKYRVGDTGCWAFERIYNDPSMNKSGKQPKDTGKVKDGQGGQSGQSGQGGQGGQGGQNSPKSPDYIAGWNQAIKDYNSGKLKI